MIYLIYGRSLTVQSAPIKIIADHWDDTSAIGQMIFKNEIRRNETGNLPTAEYEVLDFSYPLAELIRMTAKKSENSDEVLVWPRA